MDTNRRAAKKKLGSPSPDDELYRLTVSNGAFGQALFNAMSMMSEDLDQSHFLSLGDPVDGDYSCHSSKVLKAANVVPHVFYRAKNIMPGPKNDRTGVIAIPVSLFKDTKYVCHMYRGDRARQEWLASFIVPKILKESPFLKQLHDYAHVSIIRADCRDINNDDETKVTSIISHFGYRRVTDGLF